MPRRRKHPEPSVLTPAGWSVPWSKRATSTPLAELHAVKEAIVPRIPLSGPVDFQRQAPRAAEPALGFLEAVMDFLEAMHNSYGHEWEAAQEDGRAIWARCRRCAAQVLWRLQKPLVTPDFYLTLPEQAPWGAHDRDGNALEPSTRGPGTGH